MVEPMQPSGGLLGGSSSQGGQKMSKLAALAAARRKKENATQEGASAQTVNNSVALLDKLSINKETDVKVKRQSEDPPEQPRPRKYPSRKAQVEVEPAPKEPESPEPEELKEDEPDAPVAQPSAFASVLCGSQHHGADSASALPSSFSAYGFLADHPNPFAGPSPDDLVSKAQKESKSLNKNAKK